MELVPCEWAASGPALLVWNWRPVNGQLVDQLSWYGTSAGGTAVLVLELKFYDVDKFSF